ncbi:MAG: hypothetical protein LBN23_07790 [Paludibacter sp.]|jgi:hypothetical protein|nr:hypothetical protein [Paludibacter sp.]
MSQKSIIFGTFSIVVLIVKGLLSARQRGTKQYPVIQNVECKMNNVKLKMTVTTASIRHFQSSIFNLKLLSDNVASTTLSHPEH